MPTFTSTNSTAGTNVIWDRWTGTKVFTTSSTAIWTGWVSDTTYTCASISTSSSTGVWYDWNCSPVVKTAEQIARDEARAIEYKARCLALRLEREKAQEVAEQLLLEHLNPEQTEDYKQHCHFTIRGRNNVRFRIRKGRSGNVDVVNAAGRIDYRLCAHPAMDVPDCDTMLAQKIMLELDEDNFMRIANRHQAPPESMRQVLMALQ